MSVAAVVIWGGPWPLYGSGNGGVPKGVQGAKFKVQPQGSPWAGIGGSSQGTCGLGFGVLDWDWGFLCGRVPWTGGWSPCFGGGPWAGIWGLCPKWRVLGWNPHSPDPPLTPQPAPLLLHYSIKDKRR